MKRHTVGAVLTTLRTYFYHDDLATLAADLEWTGISPWFYRQLEQTAVVVPKSERWRFMIRLIMVTYDLEMSDFVRFQASPDLDAEIGALHATNQTHEAWRQRCEALAWPDSALVARRMPQPWFDPQATYQLGDVLHAVRMLDDSSVSQFADSLDLPDLLYWQMESGQLPLSEDLVTWLKRLFAVDDLTVFTHAQDIVRSLHAAAKASSERDYQQVCKWLK